MHAPTVSEIVNFCVHNLLPENAILAWDSGQWRQHVVSPLYTMVNVDGVDVELKYDGWHDAVYVRVSTMGQRGLERDDGYSIERQIREGVEAAIKGGYAFTVYSDAGLSGYYGINDLAFIAKMRCAQGRIYREVIEEDVLQNGHTWNTPEQLANMRAFLDHHVNAIVKGEKEALKDWKEEKQTDKNYRRVDMVLALRYKHHNAPKYRPGLHALLDDVPKLRNVYVSDPDRLSRNHLVFMMLGDAFRDHVTVYSSQGAADWVSGASMKDRLLHVVYSAQAEEIIKKVKRGAITGIVEMLRRGRPHSTIPYWLARDKNGWPDFVEEKLPAIRRILEYANNKEKHYGEAQIATKLQNEGIPVPTDENHPRRKKTREKRAKLGMDALPMVWHGDTVGNNVRNPLIYGCQVILGREWEIKTASGESVGLMTRDEYVAMHERRQAKWQNSVGRQTDNPAPLNKLITDGCCYLIRFKKGSKKKGDLKPTPDRYRCSCPSCERKITEDAGCCHAMFDPVPLHNFFFDLVAKYPEHLFGQDEDDPLVSYDIQETTALGRLEQARTKKSIDARNALALLKLREDTPGYQTLLENMLETTLKDEHAEYKVTMERINAARKQDSARSTVLATLPEQLRNIRNLPAVEQNNLLRRVFSEITIDRTATSMLIVLMDGSVLPAVPLVHEYGPKDKKTPICRLPSIAEWVASW